MREKRTDCFVDTDPFFRRTTAGACIATLGARSSASHVSMTSTLSRYARTTARCHEMILWGAIQGVSISVCMGHLLFLFLTARSPFGGCDACTCTVGVRSTEEG